MPLSDCEHLEFNAYVEVGRISRDEGDPNVIIYYTVALKVSCQKCGQALEFVGVPCGFSAYQPMVSFNCDELHVPMVVPGEQVPAGLPGFGVRFKAMRDDEVTKQ